MRAGTRSPTSGGRPGRPHGDRSRGEPLRRPPGPVRPERTAIDRRRRRDHDRRDAGRSGPRPANGRSGGQRRSGHRRNRPTPPREAHDLTHQHRSHSTNTSQNSPEAAPNGPSRPRLNGPPSPGSTGRASVGWTRPAGLDKTTGVDKADQGGQDLPRWTRPTEVDKSGGRVSPAGGSGRIGFSLGRPGRRCGRSTSTRRSGRSGGRRCPVVAGSRRAA